jgi:hypothetical protein
MTPIASFEHKILLETTTVSPENLPNALAELQGCWKSSSILWMHVNRFPALAGLIFNGWFQDSEEAIIRFCRERAFSELLLRIEKPGQRWTRRRGGYNVSLEAVENLVQNLQREGMMAILLEPASPYSDLFSLTSVCDVDAGKIDVEVVGPGFDASDILRADMTPHERFEIILNKPLKSAWERHELLVSRTYLIGDESYRASVRRRLAKIGARLRNPAFPDEWMDPNVSASTVEGLVQNATRYLRESGHTTLLDPSNHFEPIPNQLLDRFLKELLRLSKAVAESDISWRTFSIAGSFLSEERLVIWDFFPSGDHDVRTLSRLKS